MTTDERLLAAALHDITAEFVCSHLKFDTN